MSAGAITAKQLEAHFQRVCDERMRDLPIVNPNLRVETIGFRKFDDRSLGVLVTPWFMNLVLLPEGPEWADATQGDAVAIDFPCGEIEFTVNADDELGTWLSAILFRTMHDMPDQETARAIAGEIMQDLFVAASSERAVSRRALFTGLGAS